MRDGHRARSTQFGDSPGAPGYRMAPVDQLTNRHPSAKMGYPLPPPCGVSRVETLCSAADRCLHRAALPVPDPGAPATAVPGRRCGGRCSGRPGSLARAKARLTAASCPCTILVPAPSHLTVGYLHVHFLEIGSTPNRIRTRSQPCGSRTSAHPAARAVPLCERGEVSLVTIAR